ncbi:Hypothetical predicted protein [Mytilus galloprovincialis]|uniref:Glycosyltransferase family 92 protein n=1 Tax=Mytilus galloprovincialis TaxID=29158 RepID=A0A8B6GXZ2_MYTGA|nr:Hypothetical predicted protein [Mytilus galloprovincialis]
MLSAYLITNIEEQKDRIITVIGWEENISKYKYYTCCVRLLEGKRVAIQSTQKFVYHSDADSYLNRVQFSCPISLESRSIEGVSIITHFTKTCHKDAKFYIPVHMPLQGELAVCGTFIYGSLSANLLLEWFEVQRIIGVEKIVTYTFELNKEAMKICEHYESIGLTVLVRIADFPYRVKHVNSIDDRSVNVYTDQDVFALDCHTRMYGYKYVLGIDRDEFVLPNIRKHGMSLIKVLDKLLDNSTAGIILKPNIHVTTWEPFNKSSSLFLRQYLNSTNPVWDRVKYANLPNRTHIGSPGVHDFVPKKGFRWYTAAPADITLHHYRSCQKNWWKKFISNTNVVYEIRSILNEDSHAVSTCTYFKQYQQEDIEIIGQLIEPRVLKLRQKFNIKQ